MMLGLQLRHKNTMTVLDIFYGLDSGLIIDELLLRQMYAFASVDIFKPLHSSDFYELS